MTNILTPVGRLVQGDCFKGQDKDAEGRPLIIKTGPNAGKPRTDYFMAIAIPKTDPNWPALKSAIHDTARKGFTDMFDANGACLRPDFAFKIRDGDSPVPNKRGKAPKDCEGFPGNWILSFSGGFAPKIYAQGGGELITDPERVKRGYFIRIYGSVVSNGSEQQPGVYLNHSMVEFIAYGDEIQTGPDAEQVFGGGPTPALPPGASATPLAGAPIQQPPATPGPPAPPAANFLAGPPAPPTEVKYDVQGVPATKAQLIAKGWNEAQIATLPVIDYIAF